MATIKRLGKATKLASSAPTNSESAEDSERRDPLRLIEPVSSRLERFPSTRYYGSKRRLIGWMYGHFSRLRFDSVLDAFGGTASVSLMFQSMNKDVTYHDGFKFNEDVGHSLLAPTLTASRMKVENALRAVTPREGTISHEFRGVFFRDDENAWLDGFANHIKEIGEESQTSSLLRYLVYQACLKKRPFNLFHRANLNLRTNSNVERSFGNAVTWERSFLHHALQAYGELAAMNISDRKSATVLGAGDANDIKPGFDLVYIDPPYLNPNDRYNRDDYWRRYHFLEGLAKYDQWATQIDRNSSIRLASTPYWFSDWNRKLTFKDRLFGFIDTHRHSIVALSYLSNSIPSEAELVDFFESRFDQFSVHSAAHNHALSKSKKRELLLIGIPR